jgi:hypothetical protein
LSLTSSPNLKEPPFLSLTKISGTLLDEAKLGRCFVSHRGLQSEANSITYKLKKRKIILLDKKGASLVNYEENSMMIINPQHKRIKI